MRRPICAVLALAVTAAIGGCAQTGGLSTAFPWSNAAVPPKAGKSTVAADESQGTAAKKSESKPTEAADSKTSDADTTADKASTKTEDKKDDKAIAVAAAESKPDDKPAEKTAEEPAKKAPSSETAKKEANGLVHDAKTLELIDEELKLVPQAERDKLFAEWKDLDSAMVQQVIRIRRMVRELEASKSPSVSKAESANASLSGASNPWGINANAASPPATADLPAGIQLAAAPEAPEGDPSTAVHRQTQLVSQSDTEESGAAGSTPPNGVPANGGAVSPQIDPAEDERWNEQIRQLIASAEKRVEKASAERKASGAPDEALQREYVERHVRLRLLYLMAGDQARAMQAIPEIDPADQQFWQQVLWGLANYFDTTAQPKRSDRVTQTVEQLRTAVTRLQGEANLQLRNVAFCRKITSFGNFERFERDEYSPGQRVLLYGEIVNFKSVPQPHDGLYKTQLTSAVEILKSGQSQPLTKIEFEPTVDLCRSYRQDYFHSYELKIPEELNAGNYVLKLSVEDTQSGKVANYTLNFTVK